MDEKSRWLQGSGSSPEPAPDHTAALLTCCFAGLSPRELHLSSCLRRCVVSPSQSDVVTLRGRHLGGLLLTCPGPPVRPPRCGSRSWRTVAGPRCCSSTPAWWRESKGRKKNKKNKNRSDSRLPITGASEVWLCWPLLDSSQEQATCSPASACRSDGRRSSGLVSPSPSSP